MVLTGPPGLLRGALLWRRLLPLRQRLARALRKPDGPGVKAAPWSRRDAHAVLGNPGSSGCQRWQTATTSPGTPPVHCNDGGRGASAAWSGVKSRVQAAHAHGRTRTREPHGTLRGHRGRICNNLAARSLESGPGAEALSSGAGGRRRAAAGSGGTRCGLSPAA